MGMITARSKVIAKVIGLNLAADQRAQLVSDANSKQQIGRVVWAFGVVLAIFAATFCWRSEKHGEQISQAVPVAILGFYIVSQFILV